MSFLTFRNLGLALVLACGVGCGDDERATGGGGSTNNPGGASADGGNGAGGGGGSESGGGNTGGAGGFQANGFCSSDGWCWENPLPQGHALRDVWVSGGQAVAVGDYGTILRFDGTTWSPDALPDFTFPNLKGVWGTAIDDLFAVGDGVFHNDGSGWVELVVPFNGDERAIWGTSTSSLWVGANGALFRFDGSAWVFEHAASTDIVALSGTSDSDVWAITGEEILHRDGVGWTSIDIDTILPTAPGLLTSIWAIAPDDVWAVGDSGMLLHYDGAWSAEDPLTDETILDVWASGADDVYAIIDESSDGQPNTAHWDGSSWTLEVLIDDNPPSAIFGGSSTDIWMVGRHGQLRHYDGTTATEVSRDLLSGSVESGVWVNATDDVWLVGNNRALHFDGVDWTGQPIVGDDPTAIWSTGPDHAVVVGESGLTARWDGASWTVDAAITAEDLAAVWGSSASDVFAVGAGGTILHYDGSSWSQQPSGTTVDIASIWGSGGDDVYAVAPPSTVLHRTGAAWAPIDVGASGEVWAVGGTGAQDVNVVGDGVYRFDGSAWSADTNAPSGLRAYFATSATNRWSVGSGIYHDDGSGWTNQDSGTNAPLLDVGGAGGQVWVAGDDHTLLRRAR